jgi:hypothetical protein
MRKKKVLELKRLYVEKFGHSPTTKADWVAGKGFIRKIDSGQRGQRQFLKIKGFAGFDRFNEFRGFKKTFKASKSL